MNSYDLLRDECNKRLPDRLELKFGCEVKTKGSWPRLLGNEEPVRTDNATFIKWDDRYDEEELEEILGPDLTITDVLRALRDMLYIIDAWGNLYHLKMRLSDKAPMKGETICKFDLSLPLSADENAAACEAVLELIENV